MDFIYTNRDHKFILKEWLDAQKIFNFDAFKDFVGMEDVDMLLDEALKVAKEVVGPTNIDGDRIGAVLKDGKVTLPPSFHKLWKFLQENGYGTSQANPDEEGKLPQILNTAIHEFFGAANPSFLFVGLSCGSSELIHSFGTEKVKQMFLPKMYSGEWTGTMALTEPGGGSDVGDISSKAYATDEPGVYKIRGTKCFISAGDHDMTDNIVHLLLAKCEGAAPGTKGISLFVVPKIWVNEDGSPGEPNDVTTVAIEHKMGLHGSATVMLSFGDDDKCRGYLLGNPPNEKGIAEGMAQMFQMINGARFLNGIGGVCLAQAAYNYSLQYAKERVQGRPISNPTGPRVRIIEHEDVRRMLMFQKAIIEAGRAMIYKTSYFSDLSKYSSDPEERKTAAGRVDYASPSVKAYPTDMVWQTIAEAIQIYGGYGFMEEYPVAQYARDCKIFSIWEGTNFVQSMDLVGRKWMLEGGKLFVDWFKEVTETIESSKDLDGFGREHEIMSRALVSYKEIHDLMSSKFKEDMRVVPLFSTRVLHATAMLWAGSLLLEQAAIAVRKIKEIGEGHYEYPFYQGKVQTVKFYIRNIVPEIFKICEVVKDCDTSAIDVLEEGL